MTFFENYIDGCISKYGEEGDRTFECIGLTLKKGQILHKKCYRLAALNPSVEDEGNIRDFIASKVGCAGGDGIRLFGVSKKVSHGGISDRLTFKIDNKRNAGFCKTVIASLISEESFFCDDVLDLSHIVQQSLNSNKFPIEQIGYDVNEQGSISEIKIYVSLYQFDNACSVTGHVADQATYQRLIKEVGNLYRLNGKENILKQCLEYDCYPVLIGLNKKNDITEFKMYFGYYENIPGELRFLDFMNAINEDTGKIESILQMTQSKGLFLKGFSICWNLQNMEMTERPYFYKKQFE